MADRRPGFQQRTAIALGRGAVDRLPEEAERLGMANPLVVVDGGIVDLPPGARIKDLMPNSRAISPDPGEPTYDSVLSLLAEASNEPFDGVIAVGGGSTIDSCKVLRGLLCSDLDHPSKLTSDLDLDPLPMIAIPTTAGTGAEVGAGALITDQSSQEKTLVKHAALAADLALADGDMTLGLPPTLTAYTGLDAFAQAFLAYVPAGRDSISGSVAVDSMRTIIDFLPQAVASPNEAESRVGMMRGSVLGAMAMFNAPPTYGAEHLFAEAVGPALNLHHGYLVACFLVATVRLNAVALQEPYREVAISLGFADEGNSAEQAVEALIAGLSTMLRDCYVEPISAKVDNAPLDDLIERCVRSPAAEANPVPITPDSARNVLEAGLRGDWLE